MRKDFILNHFNTEHKPAFVEYGYGQVEPNHLSAQRTGQTYAQLPAAADIEVLQQGQFVKYDYANGVVNFSGPGEWMLVFNEIKLYREGQMDCEFAMLKDNYQARVYSPYDYEQARDKQALHYNGGPDVVVKPATYEAATSFTAGETYYTLANDEYTEATDVTAENFESGTYYLKTAEAGFYSTEDVTAPFDPYEPDYTEDPFHFDGAYRARMMPKDTTMVPRVFKTNVGDIYTTNTIDADSLTVGELLAPRADDGILVKEADADTDTTMRWQVVKIYTMPDHQRGAKLMRIV